MSILQECQEFRKKLTQWRRDFHMHPEVGFDVQRTASIVAGHLRECGIDVREKVGKTGVVGDIEIPGATERIALRADMDALPMQEEGTCSYRSTVDGKAHLCGHDAHTAMLMGAAELLAVKAKELKVNVRFLFQPNEEIVPGGALSMIDDGALDGVDSIFGQHVLPLHDVGIAQIYEGPAMGAGDIFYINITGVGGHGSTPSQTVDPVIIGSHVVTQLQTIVSRNVPYYEPAVVSMCLFQAGSACNVIPGSARLGGTTRSMSQEIREMLEEKVHQITTSVCESMGAKVEIQFHRGYPPLINDHESTLYAREKARELLDLAPKEPPLLAAEDFAYYLQKVPGCFIFLGAGNASNGITNMCHHPCFDIDETCLPLGMALHCNLVLGR